jgi:hypothetical protein
MPAAGTIYATGTWAPYGTTDHLRGLREQGQRSLTLGGLTDCDHCETGEPLGCTDGCVKCDAPHSVSCNTDCMGPKLERIAAGVQHVMSCATHSWNEHMHQNHCC